MAVGQRVIYHLKNCHRGRRASGGSYRVWGDLQNLAQRTIATTPTTLHIYDLTQLP